MCIEGEEKEDPMSIEREEAMMMEERQEAMAMTMEERQEAMTMKERQEAMMMEGAPIIVLRSVIDKHKFMVLEEVALHIPVIKARLKKLNTKLLKNKTEPPKKVFCDIEHGITKRSLKIVVKYMYNRLYPTQHSFDFEAEFLKLKPSSLILNLIQAAHSLKIKNLMDLICKRFAEKVMPDLLAIDSCNKPKPVLQNVAYPLKSGPQDSDKDCSTDISPGGPQDSDSGPDQKANLRCRSIDIFVNGSYFLDVILSPMVSSLQSSLGLWIRRLESTFNEHWNEVRKFAGLENLTSAPGNPMHLRTAILRLEEIIVGDPRFSSCLREYVVSYLAKIYEDSAYDLDIQCAVFSILSHVNLNVWGDVMEFKVFPLLRKKLVLDSTGRLFDAAVSALTRLAYMFPDRIKVIVDDSTFKAVYEAFCKPNLDIYCLSKFLVAICRGYRLSSHGVPSDKVVAVLHILENYLFTGTANDDFHVFACYTLLHLSHGRRLTLETKTWIKLVKRLIELIYIRNTIPTHSTSVEYGSKKVMIIGCALVVIGNFIRYGSLEQIEAFFTEVDLLQSLQRVLFSNIKELQMEGSRIISNLATRRTISDEIVSSGVIECLCKLLGNEDYEVKFEAAWAVINSMYGCGTIEGWTNLEMEQVK